MGGDAVERRRKGQSLLLRNESGDTRLLAAGRANRDSGGRRQPADTDGLSEVKLPPHVGPVVRQPWRRDVCMQTARHPGDRTCQLGSSRALVVARAQWNWAGCGGRNNYSQLMKTIKTRGFIKV